jgi:phospholipase C
VTQFNVIMRQHGVLALIPWAVKRGMRGRSHQGDDGGGGDVSATVWWRPLDRMSGRRRLRHRDAGRDQEMLPDPSLPPGTDRIPQIRHIVLLMMENHSFDNYWARWAAGTDCPALRR